MKIYQVTIEFADKNEKGFFLEIQSQNIHSVIRNAVKEMKEAYPCFVEGNHYSIAEVKLVEHYECGVWHK